VATKAVLRRADGQVVARAGARANDWNTAMSQRLAAGAYTIEILPGMPPGEQPVGQANTDAGSGGDGGPPADSQEGLPDTGGSSSGITLHMALPPDLRPEAAPGSLTPLAGAGVHVLSLPSPPAGALIVATAHGAGTSLVSLERQDAKGAWQTVAQGSGAPAFAAALSDGQARPWRATVWSLDDAATPVTAAVRSLTEAPQDRLAVPAGLDVAVGKIVRAAPEILDLSAPSGTLQAGMPGKAAVAVSGGHALPQGTTTWFIGPAAGELAVRPAGESVLTLDIPEGALAFLPAGKVPSGTQRVWRADGGDGQPGFNGGVVAPRSAAFASGPAPILQNAGHAGTLRVQLQRQDLALLPGRPIGSGLSLTVPPGKAVPLDIEGAAGDLVVSLAPGLAAFTGDQGGVWAPASPVTRRIPLPPRILLANLGDTSATAAVSPVPHTGPFVLRAGTLEKRFFGAAGSFELPADVPYCGEIQVAGNASLFVRDASGKVLTGTDTLPAEGPAQVVVTHGSGLVVLWIEVPGHSAWPTPSPVDAALPGALPLSGPAMSVRLKASGPMLLHATTTAPVLMGMDGQQVALFGAGAEFHRAIKGAGVLRVISPQDGPLSGTLALSAEPLRTLGEGLGETVMVPPGGSAAFSFSLAKAATIGIGVRAVPDTAHVRVFNESGGLVGEGVAQLLPDLPAGHYVLEARVPAGAPPTTLRPALLGTVPRGSGPPPDVIRGYLEEAGFKGVGQP
jgi:hypothetical protein